MYATRRDRAKKTSQWAAVASSLRWPRVPFGLPARTKSLTKIVGKPHEIQRKSTPNRSKIDVGAILGGLERSRPSKGRRRTRPGAAKSVPRRARDAPRALLGASCRAKTRPEARPDRSRDASRRASCATLSPQRVGDAIATMLRSLDAAKTTVFAMCPP